jgi:hypothetical protein
MSFLHFGTRLESSPVVERHYKYSIWGAKEGDLAVGPSDGSSVRPERTDYFSVRLQNVVCE